MSGLQASGTPAANGGLSAPFNEADFSDPASGGAPNGVAAAPYANASGVSIGVHPSSCTVHPATVLTAVAVRISPRQHLNSTEAGGEGGDDPCAPAHCTGPSSQCLTVLHELDAACVVGVGADCAGGGGARGGDPHEGAHILDSLSKQQCDSYMSATFCVLQVSAQFAPPAEEPEAVTQMKEHLRQRMKDQEQHEVDSKKKGEEDARAFLDVRLFPAPVSNSYLKVRRSYRSVVVRTWKEGEECARAFLDVHLPSSPVPNLYSLVRFVYRNMLSAPGRRARRMRVCSWMCVLCVDTALRRPTVCKWFPKDDARTLWRLVHTWHQLQGRQGPSRAGSQVNAAALQEFYQKRTATKNASIKEHREAHKLLGDQKPEGKNEWERAIRWGIILVSLTTSGCHRQHGVGSCAAAVLNPAFCWSAKMVGQGCTLQGRGDAH